MRSLLLLYLTKHFIVDDRSAAGLYGGYTALVYLTPLIGGYLADQYLGSKRSVKFGSIMMAAGYLTLCFGGQTAQPYAPIDGHRYDVQVSNYSDGPSRNAHDAPALLRDGHALAASGNQSANLLPRRADGRGGPRDAEET